MKNYTYTVYSTLKKKWPAYLTAAHTNAHKTTHQTAIIPIENTASTDMAMQTNTLKAQTRAHTHSEGPEGVVVLSMVIVWSGILVKRSQENCLILC